MSASEKEMQGRKYAGKGCAGGDSKGCSVLGKLLLTDCAEGAAGAAGVDGACAKGMEHTISSCVNGGNDKSCILASTILLSSGQASAAAASVKDPYDAACAPYANGDGNGKEVKAMELLGECCRNGDKQCCYNAAVVSKKIGKTNDFNVFKKRFDAL